MEANCGTLRVAWRRRARHHDADRCLVAGRARVSRHIDWSTEERRESEEGRRVVDEGKAGEESGEDGLEEGQRR